MADAGTWKTGENRANAPEGKQPESQADVIVISGFLGAGKTTLLRHILGLDMDFSKTVVLVNEFGSVGIDGALIRQTAAADVVEMSNGCICCTLKIDLIETLNRLWENFCPARVFIEATGVADPLSIAAVLRESALADRFRLSRTVTVVDADFWEAREAFGHVFPNQLAGADLILVNKVDTLDRDQISRVLEEIQREYPGKRIVPTFYCAVEPDILFPGGRDQAGKGFPGICLPVYDPSKDVTGTVLSGGSGEPDSNSTGNGSVSGRETGFMAFSWAPDRILDRDRFKEFLSQAPATLFRIKGPVRFKEGTRMLHGVGENMDWTPWQGDPGTCLAFVGWNIDQATILERLNACLLHG
ncbi:MAG: GTP-binding protein [Pseudomonadota bacterium]